MIFRSKNNFFLTQMMLSLSNYSPYLDNSTGRVRLTAHFYCIELFFRKLEGCQTLFNKLLSRKQHFINYK